MSRQEQDPDWTKAPQPPSSAAITYLSGPRRGTTDWIEDDVVEIGSSVAAEVHVSSDADSDLGVGVAWLHRHESGYELVASPGASIWIDSERVPRRTLYSGDVGEVQDGPVLRFRVYAPGTPHYKRMGDVFTDCVDCANQDGDGALSRARIFASVGLRDLVTQTAPVLRWSMGAMIVALTLTLVALGVQSWRLSSQLAAEEAKLRTMADTIAELRRESPTKAGVDAMRDALRSDMSEAKERMDSLENQLAGAERVIAQASGATGLVFGKFHFRHQPTGRLVRMAERAPDKPNEVTLTLRTSDPPLELATMGTAFLIDDRGHLITNHHVAAPWAHNGLAKGFRARQVEPVPQKYVVFVPDLRDPYEIHLVHSDRDNDLTLLKAAGLPSGLPHLRLARDMPSRGDDVVLLGYPAGVQALLARAPRALRQAMSGADRESADYDMLIRLADRELVQPLATKGIVGQVTQDALAYDADTTMGGSGGPVLNLDGEVVAINAAKMARFGGSNLGVPVASVRKLLDQANVTVAAKPR